MHGTCQGDRRPPQGRYEPGRAGHLLKLGSFGYGKTFEGMVGRCLPNSGYGGSPGTRVMTILVFYVSAQIPNIQYGNILGAL